MTAEEAYREAQARIRHLQGDSLDLAIFELTQLPGEIASLSSLKTLSLEGTRLADISVLEQLVELRCLDLGGTPEINTLAPLSRLRHLEVLNLTARGETDIRPLEELTTLRELHLGGAGIADLSPLSNLCKLEVLDLNDIGGPLTDISALARLTQLTCLDLSGHNDLRDLAPLRLLKNLKSLNLWNCAVTDLSPLRSLTRLTVLNLADTMVSDLSPLRDIPLEELDLASGPIVDYSDLACFSALRTLRVGGSIRADSSDRWCRDFSAIGKLACLQELELHLPAISFSFLKSCRRMKALSVIGQDFTELGSFCNLAELESLLIYNCPNLMDLSGLSSLQRLTKLELNFCEKIADVIPIAGLSLLRELKITYANLTDVSELGRLHSLERLELTHCRRISRLGSFHALRRLQELVIESGEFSDLSGLASLPELERLVLAGCEKITDISVVATLPKIRDLGLHASTNIKQIRPLEAIVGQLRNLELDCCKFADAPDFAIGFEENMTEALRRYFDAKSRRSAGY